VNPKREDFERPLLGYVLIAVALLIGLITANAFGQNEVLDAEPSHSQASSANIQSHTVPPQIRRRRWVLGVRANATPTGYLIDQVQSSSTAEKAGLEAGDRIIAVAGKRVGYVDTHLISLAKTLDQTGGRSGYSSILIQNRRNRRLVSLQVALQSPNEMLGH